MNTPWGWVVRRVPVTQKACRLLGCGFMYCEQGRRARAWRCAFARYV